MAVGRIFGDSPLHPGVERVGGGGGFQSASGGSAPPTSPSHRSAMGPSPPPEGRRGAPVGRGRDGARPRPQTGGPKRVGSLHHSDKRLNIPTAEMQSFFQREEDHSPLPPAHYPRQLPLAEGEHRERDPDRDPQLSVERHAHHPDRGAAPAIGRDRRNRDRRRATGVARQGYPGLVRPDRPDAAALHPGKDPPQGDHRRSEAPQAAATARQRPTSPICSPISMACRATRRPSSTSTRRTGRTA